MNIIASGENLATLPQNLLVLAKSHLRIDGIYDDAYVTDALKRAISWFQRVTGVSVNPITWTWTPDADSFCDGAATVPVSPVTDFGVTANSSDITDSYDLTTLSTHGVGLFQLKGSFATGMVVDITSGYADANALDPGITDALLRYTAHLYENREILVPGTDAQTPGWMLDVIATYWMPRA